MSENLGEELNIDVNPRIITFGPLDSWVMKIELNGEDRKISFNHEQFPNLGADGFAKEVMNILENSHLY